MENRKILNRDVILQVEGIKPGLAGKLLDTFLGHAPGRYRDCRKGLESGDWRAVEDAVHSLKSSAGHLGAELLLDLCGRMEASAETGDGESVTAMAAEFESVYALTVEALERERQSWIPKEG